MRRQPSAASASPVGRVTLTLYGPIGDLAAALRTLADALDHEQATNTITYTTAVEPQGRGPAPGGMTAFLADRFAQLTPAAVDVVALLCCSTPEPATRRSRLKSEPSSASTVTSLVGC